VRVTLREVGVEPATIHVPALCHSPPRYDSPTHDQAIHHPPLESRALIGARVLWRTLVDAPPTPIITRTPRHHRRSSTRSRSSPSTSPPRTSSSSPSAPAPRRRWPRPRLYPRLRLRPPRLRPPRPRPSPPSAATRPMARTPGRSPTASSKFWAPAGARRRRGSGRACETKRRNEAWERESSECLRPAACARASLSSLTLRPRGSGRWRSKRGAFQYNYIFRRPVRVAKNHGSCCTVFTHTQAARIRPRAAPSGRRAVGPHSITRCQQYPQGWQGRTGARGAGLRPPCARANPEYASIGDAA
jgi:hypothetical protein